MNFRDNKLIKEIYIDCKANLIPNIRDETAKLLVETINQNNSKKVLEIGTAYGYSAAIIYFNTKCEITTIEKDIPRYIKASSFIGKLDRIKIIKEDCFNIELKDKFDFIFIDGPKSNQIELFNKIEKYLTDDGTIFIDNFYLKAFDNKKELSNNQIKIKKNILLFQEFIKGNSEFKISIHDIDDGVVILKRK